MTKGTACKARLLAEIFRERPLWKQGFSAHVKAWERWSASQSMRLFVNNPAFRAEYHARGGQLEFASYD
jgi:hypothetical protein